MTSLGMSGGCESYLRDKHIYHLRLTIHLRYSKEA